MRKYIPEIINSEFVFPNASLSEYDIEIVHDLKDISVSGTVTNFITSTSGSNINVSFNYTWSLNTAEPFIRKDGQLSILTVHMMSPDKVYLRPWRVVGDVSTATTGSTTYSGSFTTTVTPSMMGVSSFIDGEYEFEVRFIGHRALYTLCVQSNVTYPVPTPTPTPTYIPTSPTPTPTLTPTPTPSMTGNTCGALFSGQYEPLNYYMYPDTDVWVSPSTTTVTFNWGVVDRPNRFSVYDENGNLLHTTGWVGTANYAGPWGMSLSTSDGGSFNITTLGKTYFKLRVEAGNSQGLTDYWSVSVNCIP